MFQILSPRCKQVWVPGPSQKRAKRFQVCSYCGVMQVFVTYHLILKVWPFINCVAPSITGYSFVTSLLYHDKSLGQSIGRVGPPQRHMFFFCIFELHLCICIMTQVLSNRQSGSPTPLQDGAVSHFFSFACHHITQKGTQHSCLLNKLDVTIFWLMLKYYSAFDNIWND